MLLLNVNFVTPIFYLYVALVFLYMLEQFLNVNRVIIAFVLPMMCFNI